MPISCIQPLSDIHPLDRAAVYLGGRAAMAVLLTVSESAIGNWKVRGVPIVQCVAIERLTSGRVTRQQLRPGDWHLIWPELVLPGTQAALPLVSKGAAHV